jgi:hypothetical protein
MESLGGNVPDYNFGPEIGVFLDPVPRPPLDIYIEDIRLDEMLGNPFISSPTIGSLSAYMQVYLTNGWGADGIGQPFMAISFSYNGPPFLPPADEFDNTTILSVAIAAGVSFGDIDLPISGGFAYWFDTTINFRINVDFTGLRVKVWRTDTAEPADWMISETYAEAGFSSDDFLGTEPLRAIILQSQTFYRTPSGSEYTGILRVGKVTISENCG